jgi:phosphatidylglycerol:prolipoprotein diacylglycerol transferase
LGSQTLGMLTDVPWRVSIFGQNRHPAHLYLVIAVLLILGLLWSLRQRSYRPSFIFLLFVELYAAARLLLDPFFETQQFLGNGFRAVQVAALGVMIVTLVVMMWVDQQRKTPQSTSLES